jgi:hypothetical protein
MLHSYNSALYVVLYLIFRKSCLLLIGILLQFQWGELCNFLFYLERKNFYANPKGKNSIEDNLKKNI